MYCSNCGNQIPDNSKFCSKCGSPVVSQNVNTEVIPNPKPNKTSKKGIIAGVLSGSAIALAAVVFCIIAIGNNRNKPNVNPNSTVQNTQGNHNSVVSEVDNEEGEIVYKFPKLSVHHDNYDWSKVKDKESYDMGDGSVFYPSKNLIVYENSEFYQGEWENNQKHGKGVYTFKDGTVFEGEFFKGEVFLGKFLYMDNATYEGSCANNLPHGTGLLVLPDKKTYYGGWISGRFLEGEGNGMELGDDSKYPVISSLLEKRNNKNSGSDSQQTNTEPSTSNPGSDDNPVLVVEALSENPTQYSITEDSVYIQDLVDFCSGKLSYSNMSTPKAYQIRTFKGKESDLAIIDAYVNAICDGKHNFKLTKKYKNKISDKFTSYSYGIDYTGKANVKTTYNVNFTDVDCNMQIYGTIENGKLEAKVWVPYELDIVDLGLRYGESNQQSGTKAESAATGLYRLSDGSFRTQDGRLTAKPGQATVLRDGKSYTVAATYGKNRGGTRDELWLKGYYNDETIVFFTPSDSIKTNSIFTYKNLMMEQSWLNSSPTLEHGEKTFTEYTFPLCFGICHDADWIMPLSGEYNQFKDLYVRVMYFDPGNTAVFYIYAEFDSKPKTVEALCVVNLKNASKPEKVDGEYSVRVGEKISIDCGRESDSTYNTYEWEITEGESLAVLEGNTHQQCSIIAKNEGTVRVRVLYEYGIKEPDVLTGNMRTSNKSKTLEYLITIKKK